MLINNVKLTMLRPTNLTLLRLTKKGCGAAANREERQIPRQQPGDIREIP